MVDDVVNELVETAETAEVVDVVEAEVVSVEEVLVEDVVEDVPAPEVVAPVKKAAAKKAAKKAVAKVVGPVYVARKKITVKGKVFRPGDVVPDASSWTRIESWVRTGYLSLEER
jgi:hypothetical protein